MKFKGQVVLKPYFLENKNKIDLPFIKHFNMVVNTGRNFLARHIRERSSNHILGFLAVGRSTLSPSLGDTALKDRILDAGYIYRSSYELSPPLGELELIFDVDGDLFSFPGEDIGEAGLFLEDGSSPGVLYEDPTPLMVARIIFDPVINVHPTINGVKRGFTLSWFINF